MMGGFGGQQHSIAERLLGKGFETTGPTVREACPLFRPDTGTALIVTLLLSLGLWAAIWGAITSLLLAL